MADPSSLLSEVKAKLAEIKWRHDKDEPYRGYEMCECGQVCPCDAARLLAGWEVRVNHIEEVLGLNTPSPCELVLVVELRDLHAALCGSEAKG